MNPGYVMLRSMRRLEKLMLYKNMKVFGYAVNGVENYKNYELYLYVGFEEHVHIEGLKNKYVYELKYKIVRLKVRRTV